MIDGMQNNQRECCSTKVLKMHFCSHLAAVAESGRGGGKGEGRGRERGRDRVREGEEGGGDWT